MTLLLNLVCLLDLLAIYVPVFLVADRATYTFIFCLFTECFLVLSLVSFNPSDKAVLVKHMVESKPLTLKKYDLLLRGINTVITESTMNLLEKKSFRLLLQE